VISWWKEAQRPGEFADISINFVVFEEQLRIWANFGNKN
jgi:hypothetical protein